MVSSTATNISYHHHQHSFHTFQAPFQVVVEDAAAMSSEDGSGLHSPTFGDCEMHQLHNYSGPHPDIVDINGVAGLLAASNFNTPPIAATVHAQAHAQTHTLSHIYPPPPPPPYVHQPQDGSSLHYGYFGQGEVQEFGRVGGEYGQQVGFGIGHGGQSAERVSATSDGDDDRRSRFLADASAPVPASQFGNVRHTPPHLNQQPQQPQQHHPATAQSAVVDSSNTNNNNSGASVSQQPPSLPSLLPPQHHPASPRTDSDKEPLYAASGISTMSDSENVSTRPTTAISESVGDTREDESENVKQENQDIKTESTSGATPTASASGSGSASASTSGPPPKRVPSLVVIACRQCRARKIRCDSTRPACNNCLKRNNECAYDSVPKRRGPDKNPGTRQRSCKKRPTDGSMPVKKKQKKGSESGSGTMSPGSPNGSLNGTAVSGVSSMGGLHHGLEPAVSAMRSSGLRLDMSYVGGRNGVLPGGYHDPGASAFQYLPTSASTSPTNAVTLHTYPHYMDMPRSAGSAMASPELRLPKVVPQRTRSPFSLYEYAEPVEQESIRTHHYSTPLNVDVRVHQPYTSFSAARQTLTTSTITNDIHYGDKLWWENLVSQYTQFAHSREHAERTIKEELHFLFNNQIHWLSFINERHFFRTITDENEREKMQPALVYAALALSTLLQSSEVGKGHIGRERALWLRDAAQTLLQASWRTPDPGLAQAAMLIAIFESSAHPAHTADRVCQALSALDHIIRQLALTHQENNQLVNVFPPQMISAVHRPTSSAGSFSPAGMPDSTISLSPGSVEHDRSRPGSQRGPSGSGHPFSIMSMERSFCAPPVHSPQLDMGRMSPTWATSITWDASWTEADVRAEETRRLCWSALSLAVEHTAHCAAFRRDPLDLFITRPENYQLLYPDEKRLTQEGDYRSSQSVWALYCRSMLIWNKCLRLTTDTRESERAEMCMEAWQDAQAVQDGLDAHLAVTTESHLIYMTWEHLFNIRIALTYEFRRLSNLDDGHTPRFNRRQAIDWLTYQNRTSATFKQILNDGANPQSHILARRPFYVWWFMSQMDISMSLYANDNSLVAALDLCREFLVPLNVLSGLWPCQAQRTRYLQLREQLAVHCKNAGLPPLPPTDFTLPLGLRP